MRQIALMIATTALFLSPTAAQDPTKIPPQIQKHMESMVGSWTFEGRQGDRKFFGQETVRLTNNKTALLQEGYFDLGGGEKEHYVILSGWDGSAKTVFVRGFTTDGISWTGEWKKLKDGKWLGTASGGRAEFEVKKNTMRYEDAGDGTPWISEFTRK
ncbi:MAG: hypothetical protein AAFV88_20770 [Planctomycetota bacterium]